MAFAAVVSMSFPGEGEDTTVRLIVLAAIELLVVCLCFCFSVESWKAFAALDRVSYAGEGEETVSKRIVLALMKLLVVCVSVERALVLVSIERWKDSTREK